MRGDAKRQIENSDKKYAIKKNEGKEKRRLGQK